jgi:predicted secreted protein
VSYDERFARYLDTGTDPDAPAEFRALREQLGAESTWLEPPVELQEAIVTDIVAQHGPATQRRAPSRWSLQRWVAAAAVAAAIALGAVVVLSPSDAQRFEMQLQGTELAQGGSAIATIQSTSSGEDITLDVRGLPPAPEGFYYQGWVRDGDNAITIGTFHLRGGDDEVTLWAGVDIEDFPVITVTIEPDDGDPASSGNVVLRGELTPAR